MDLSGEAGGGVRMRLAGAYGVFVHEPRPQPAGQLAVALPEARHSERSIGFAIATNRDQLSPTPRLWLATATGRRRIGKASRGGTKQKKKLGTTKKVVPLSDFAHHDDSGVTRLAPDYSPSPTSAP